MAEQDGDTERVAVKTYVPAYQKEAWADHAERLGMSQSEFVRTMVQAGRRDFELPTPEEPDLPDGDPGGDGLEDRVLDLLLERGVLDWDELVGAVTEDVEDRLDDALERLQSENRVQYSGREGGYAAVDP